MSFNWELESKEPVSGPCLEYVAGSSVIDFLTCFRGSAGKKYNLVTTFPSKVYKDMEENLFSAGLTPNATMHIRPLKE